MASVVLAAQNVRRQTQYEWQAFANECLQPAIVVKVIAFEPILRRKDERRLPSNTERDPAKRWPSKLVDYSVVSNIENNRILQVAKRLLQIAQHKTEVSAQESSLSESF